MFLNIQIDLIILKTYDQQFTLTTKKSLHITFKSVEILSAAAQLYEKSHLTRRIALSCGIKISPVGSLD